MKIYRKDVLYQPPIILNYEPEEIKRISKTELENSPNNRHRHQKTKPVIVVIRDKELDIKEEISLSSSLFLNRGSNLDIVI